MTPNKREFTKEIYDIEQVLPKHEPTDSVFLSPRVNDSISTHLNIRRAPSFPK